MTASEWATIIIAIFGGLASIVTAAKKPTSSPISSDRPSSPPLQNGRLAMALETLNISDRATNDRLADYGTRITRVEDILRDFDSRMKIQDKRIMDVYDLVSNKGA